MPITSIISQPGADSISAAYRPIILQVKATKTGGGAEPPVVYCDVYVNDVFYKSIPKTQHKQLNVSDSDWQFDIQDPLQEVLKKVLANNGESNILPATGAWASVYCKFRSSGYDVNGFTVPEGTAPVQGTGRNVPVSGSGTQSNTFFILNTVLQHENNQDLATHLNAYKTRIWNNAYPLSHRPGKFDICNNNAADVFPIFYAGTNALTCVRVRYRAIGQSTYHKITNCLGDDANLVFSWDKNAGESVDLTGKVNGTFTEVDWGDGTVDNLLTHTYANSNNYTVKFYNSNTTLLLLGNKFGPPLFKITTVTVLPNTLVDINLIQTFIPTLPSLASLGSLSTLKITSPNLASIPDVSANTQLTILQIVNSVASAGGVVDLANNTLLTTVELYGNHLTGITGTASLAACNVFHAYDNELNTAAVNTILTGLDTASVINGYSKIDNQTPAAAPSGGGATAVTNLTGKGWTVITD